jgi:hypothetical protein
VIRELMEQSKYKDLTTLTIDFDTDMALVKAYNVRVQSTLIVLIGKQEEGRSVGDTSREGIEHLLNSVVTENIASAEAIYGSWVIQMWWSRTASLRAIATVLFSMTL